MRAGNVFPEKVADSILSFMTGGQSINTAAQYPRGVYWVINRSFNKLHRSTALHNPAKYDDGSTPNVPNRAPRDWNTGPLAWYVICFTEIPQETLHQGNTWHIGKYGVTFFLQR